MEEHEMISKAKEILKEIKGKFPNYPNLNKTIIEINNRLRIPSGRVKFEYSFYVIEINPHLFYPSENCSEFRETILHEIAHIIAGLSFGHSHIWKKILLRIGGNGKRCHKIKTGLKRNKTKRHLSYCSICNKEFSLSTRRKNMILKGYKFHHISCGKNSFILLKDCLV